MKRSADRSPKVPNAAAPGKHPVDLCLPENKLPTALEKFSSYSSPRTVEKIFGESYAIGSSKSEEKIYHDGRDLGLFQCVYEAWKNHYNLRTTPEDWWFPVACMISKAIEQAANNKVRIIGGGQHYSQQGKEIRDLFVDHKGKKNIGVEIDVFTIYDVDYESFFADMSSEITSRIKVPKYAGAMQNDFSTSSTTHCIASQINLMAGLGEFFTYESMLTGCGIKGVEMRGKQEDWDNLATKLHIVKEQLEPAKGALWGLSDGWWSHVESVFEKLADTYAAKSDSQLSQVADFWADILMIGDGWKWGNSGSVKLAAKKYNGWLLKFLTGLDEVLEEDFFRERNMKRLRGMNSVPLKITKTYMKPNVSDEATLTTGIMGFEIHEKDTFNGVPSLQPHHMWALELPTGSPLRS